VEDNHFSGPGGFPISARLRGPAFYMLLQGQPSGRGIARVEVGAEEKKLMGGKRGGGVPREPVSLGGERGGWGSGRGLKVCVPWRSRRSDAEEGGALRECLTTWVSVGRGLKVGSRKAREVRTSSVGGVVEEGRAQGDWRGGGGVKCGAVVWVVGKG